MLGGKERVLDQNWLHNEAERAKPQRDCKELQHIVKSEHTHLVTESASNNWPHNEAESGKPQ